MRRNALEAVHARDFLDQVFLDFDVEAERGRRDHEHFVRSRAFARGLQAEAMENVGDLVGGHRHPDHLVRAGDAHHHRLALGQARDQVLDRAGLAAADVQDEPRGALDAGHVVVEIHAALEAVRRVAREIVAPRAARDHLRERRTPTRDTRAASQYRPWCCPRP